MELERSDAVFEPPAVVAGLDDVAVVGQAVEPGRRHLGLAEHTGPFAKGEVGGHDHRGLLVEAADQVEQQLSTGLGERQIAQLIQHDEVHPAQIFGHPSLTTGASLGLEFVDQFDDVEEPAPLAIADEGSRHRNGQMRLAGTAPADQHDVALMREKVAAPEMAHQGFVDRRVVELEVVDVLGQRSFGDRDLVADRPWLASR
jgi:hypothetical protein